MTDAGEKRKAAPGWYTDPKMAGTQRYWDGARWTENVAPVAPPPPAKRSNARAIKWVATIVGLAFLVPVLGVTFLQPSAYGESCGSWVHPRYTDLEVALQRVDLTMDENATTFDLARLEATAEQCSDKLATRRLFALILLGVGLIARFSIPPLARAFRT